MSNDNEHEPVSWLDKLGVALLREPKDREQLVNLIRDAESRNLINADALSMLEGALHVSDMQARDIMVPKSQVVSLSIHKPIEDIIPIITETAHSRFPVYDQSFDHIIGILHAKDLLLQFKDIANINLKELLRPANVIPESKRLDVLLKELRINRNHMAIVVDEYGKTSGLITIEDILEQIVGEIEDEFDEDDDDEQFIKKHSPSKFIIKALTPVETFNEYFDTNLDSTDFNTLGGIITNAFGHLPNRGEQVTIDRFCFKVLHADKRKIHLLQLNLTIKAND